MFNYNKRSITILAILISIIIFISVNLIILTKQKNQNTQEEKNELVLTISKQLQSEEQLQNQLRIQTETQEINSKQLAQKEESWETTIISKTENIEKEKQETWKLEIPAIALSATILEGTTRNNMRKAITHFEDTSIWEGNVCLAAHNRGYKYGFFSEIKNLQLGDEIYYKTINGTKRYVVETNTIIKETDWTYLQPSNFNKITLITCEANKPEYRRCVQAIEV